MATTTTTTTVSHHGHHGVPELDLSALRLQTSSVVDRFNETVPGLRTSADRDEKARRQRNGWGIVDTPEAAVGFWEISSPPMLDEVAAAQVRFCGPRGGPTFFTFLRANLALDAAMSSPSVNTETPQLTPLGATSPLASPPSPPSPYTIHSLSSASSASSESSSPFSSFPSPPLSRATSSAASSRAPSTRRPSTRGSSEAGVPTSSTSHPGLPRLSLSPASSPPTKAAALRLIAASISEDRASAAKRLARHPLCLSLLLAVLTTACRLCPRRDTGTLLALFSGLAGAYLALARCLTAGYEAASGGVAPSFLVRDHATGEEDVVVAALWGADLVGSLVLRLEPAGQGPGSWSPNVSPPHSSGRGGNNRRHKPRGSIGSLKSLQRRGGKGVIRAWTVQEGYRGRGVGTHLLSEAVKTVREKMGREAEVGFAREHANATRVLPEWLDGDVRRRETRAWLALRDVVRDWDGRGRRRRAGCKGRRGAEGEDARRSTCG
ncbi:hypothetical protein MKZ38_009651 [Zalerion maritima]|uniref:N-acetyltransferase domain-containing protein n=1 Tax=Zalerion maritima TaxID=339359 RepID=A0AAD5RUC5_9PEZI|nr:hypothetical protein MKZ38_009651 [Zalerion maritima]